MTQHSISIIIPVRDGARTLRGCLEALERQTIDRDSFEVIVVDDGSGDESAAIARELDVTILSQKPRGAAAARNRGLSASSGSLVVFLDADCRPRPDWLERLIAPLSRDGTDGTVGRFVSSQGGFVARLIQADLDLRYDRMERFDQVDFINTATCAFRRHRLPAAPFDESFIKLEDLDFSFRLAKAGLQMRFAGKAVVEHRHPESLSDHCRRRYLYGRYAPALYREHSSKAVSDSSTPPGRRLQLVFLGLSLPLAVAWWPAGLASLAASFAFSIPLFRRAWRDSPLLIFLGFAYLLAGNLAFLWGSFMGLGGMLTGRH